MVYVVQWVREGPHYGEKEIYFDHKENWMLTCFIFVYAMSCTLKTTEMIMIIPTLEHTILSCALVNYNSQNPSHFLF